MLVEENHRSIMCDVRKSEIGVHVNERLVTGDIRVLPFLRKKHFPAIN